MTTFFEESPPPSAVAVAEEAQVPAEIGPEEQARNVKKAALIMLGSVALILALVVAWYLIFGKPLQLPGVSTSSIPTYSASLYGATQPMGVAIDEATERVYVTSSGGNFETKVYSRSGQELGSLTPPDSKPGQHVPVYVAVSPVTGEVYISDRTTNQIYVYDNAGTYQRTFDPAGDIKKTWQPLAVAFDKDGNLYVSDVGGPQQQIYEFSPDGNVVRNIGTPGMTSFANAIVIDEANNVIVSDSNNGRVLFFAPDNTVLTQINRGSGDSELGMPRGLALSGNRLFVVDSVNQRIQNYDINNLTSAGPKYLGVFGVEGTDEGAFEFPNGAAADDKGRVYITDRVNNRTQVWSW